jgi:hypothetical protein
MTSHTHGTDHPGAYPLTARCGAIVTDDGPGTCVGPTWTRARVLDPRLGMLPPCPVCFPEGAAKRSVPDLRGLAEAATPGPWVFDSYSRVWVDDADSESLAEVAAVPVVAGDTATRQGSADAAYIAAANPQAVIGLLNERDRLHDLVRHQRGPLHDAGLLTDEEYATLAADHGAVGRLETVDQLRATLATVTRERDDARVYIDDTGKRIGVLQRLLCNNDSALPQDVRDTVRLGHHVIDEAARILLMVAGGRDEARELLRRLNDIERIDAHRAGYTGCKCMARSKAAEQAYEMGRCPHQLADAALAGGKS